MNARLTSSCNPCPLQRADYGVPCYGAGYDTIRGVAWLGVLIYPIGVPVAYTLLLTSARHHLLTEKRTPLTHALRFLHAEYKPSLFWWELVEVTRRLLLVGIAVLVSPGSVVQLIFGVIVSVLFLTFQFQAKPYRSEVDAFLAMTTSLSTVLLFLGALVLKMGTLVEYDDVNELLPPALLANFTVPSATMSFILFVCLLGSIIITGMLLILQLARDARNARMIDPRWDTEGFRAWATKGQVVFLKVT